jgi:hypothetical protein
MGTTIKLLAQNRNAEKPVTQSAPVRAALERSMSRLRDRECTGCGEQGRGILQRAAVNESREPVDQVPPLVHQVLREPGEPLDIKTRSMMETRFGHDFGHVRVHSDSHAAESAEAVDAAAYTVGHHVVFAEGQYAPHTPTGQQLLLHELAHAVQQEHQAVPADLGIDAPGGPAEQQAQNLAASAPRRVAVLPGDRPVSPLLQRQPKKSGKGSDVEKRLTMLENQQKATSVLLEFQNRVLAIATGWEDAVLNIGSAYTVAAQRHRQAISDDAAHAAIVNQIMMTVLTTLTAGAFSWVVNAATYSGVSEAEMLGPSLQSAAKGGVEKVIPPSTLVDQYGRPFTSAGAPPPFLLDPSERPIILTTPAAPAATAGPSSVPSGPAMEGMGAKQLGSKAVVTGVSLAAQGTGTGPGPVSDDPLLFENERMSQVKKDEKQAYDYFATLANQLRTAPPDNWMNYDPQAQLAAHQSWLKSTKLLGTKADLPSIEQMAQEIERGFWAEWVKSVHPITSYAALTTSYPDIGDHVAKRLKELGIVGQAGLELSGITWFSHGYLFYDSTYSDWQKLKQWAATFMPKVFFPSK